MIKDGKKKKKEITLLNLGRKRVPFFEKKNGWNDYALYVKYMKIIKCLGDYFYIHPYFDTFTKVGSTGVI